MRHPALPLLAALSLAAIVPAPALAGGRGGGHHAAPRPQVHHAAPRPPAPHHPAPRPAVQHHSAPKPQAHHNPAPKPAAPKPQAQHHAAPKPQAHPNNAPKPQAHPKSATPSTAAKTPKDQPHNKPTSKPQHSTAATKLAKNGTRPNTNSTSPSIFSPVPNPSQNINGPVPKPTQATFAAVPTLSRNINGPVPNLSQNLNGPVPSLKTASGRSVHVQQNMNTATSRSVTNVNRTVVRGGLVGVGYPGTGYGYNPWAGGYRRRSYGYGYNRYHRNYYRPRRYYVARRPYVSNNVTNVAPDPALQRLRADLESIPLGAATTKTQTARLADDLLGVVQGPIQPPQGPVQALAGHLAEGVARRKTQGVNALPLAQSLKVAMNGAFLSRNEVGQAITQGQRALHGLGVPSGDIGQITRQLRLIALDNAPAANPNANPNPNPNPAPNPGPAVAAAPGAPS